MTHVAMLLSNPFRPDPRVLKEANSLAKSGYSVSVVCWDRSAEFSPEETLNSGVRIIRIQNVPSEYGIGKRQLLRLSRFWLGAYGMLNRLKPYLIHCHDFDTLPAGLAWGRLHAAPVIFDAHEYYAELCRPRLHGFSGTVLFQLIRFFERLGARYASAVVTVDDTLGAIYRRFCKRVVIVGHYPSLNLIEAPAPVFSHPELNLVYIGRLSTDRGIIAYAKLVRSLISMGIPTRLILAGVFTPSSEEDVFIQAIKGLEGAVELAGWVHYDRVASLLERADVGLAILQPIQRYIAALPVKLFEYMAAGLPVIASDFPLIKGVVEQAECGILVDPLDDPQSIAEQVKDWWQNPSHPRKLGANGRKAILERYNWEARMQELVELYRSLLA